LSGKFPSFAIFLAQSLMNSNSFLILDHLCIELFGVVSIVFQCLPMSIW
jgi:hypothetical protein